MMTRLMTELSKSPERISHHLRCKPSTPIEIPKRSRTSGSYKPSGDQLSSPELIFEMSPCSAEKSAISKRPASPSSSGREHEPFMYNAPPLTIYPTGYIPPLRSKIPCQRLTPSRKPSLIQVGTEFQNVGQTKSTLSHLFDSAQALNSPGAHGSRRSKPTTKITGFTPIIEHQPPTCDESFKPKKLVLPPPPRRSSYSSSPWILPGRGDHHEEDLSYSQTDPSALEFHNHLLQRMENRDSSRFKPVHTCL